MKLILFWLIVLAIFFGSSGAYMTQMPGESMVGALPPATDDEQAVSSRLEDHVEMLAHQFSTRGGHAPETTLQAVDYLERSLTRAGYEVRQHSFESRRGFATNLEATRLGTTKKSEFVLVAAHYDCEPRSPGADANASGCAALIEIARIMADTQSERSLRFVLLANGSGNYAGDERSGAAAYVRETRKRGEKFVAAVVLDGLGFYKDAAGSQSVPFPFGFVYPDTGNYLFFAGDLTSRDLVRQAIGAFRTSTRFPSEGIAVPGFTPGFATSDHAAFLAGGIPSVLVTDTGTLRNPGSNGPADTHDRLDYGRMGRVTLGLSRVIVALAKSSSLL